MEWAFPESVYIVGDCPLGCGGDDLVALKARGSASFFLYCPSCGLAYRPGAINLDVMLTTCDLAENGIEFPTQNEVEEEFGGSIVQVCAFSRNDFWESIALTYLSENDVSHALEVVDAVLESWFHPPDAAQKLRLKILGHQGQDAIERARDA